jgi:hypothetical protein
MEQLVPDLRNWPSRPMIAQLPDMFQAASASPIPRSGENPILDSVERTAEHPQSSWCDPDSFSITAAEGRKRDCLDEMYWMPPIYCAAPIGELSVLPHFTQ